jgi:glycosyltransferase involved in cell wall biosynthesis
MIRLVFLIRSLEIGGSEQQLVTLAKSIDRASFDPTVITFYSGGILEEELRNAGVQTISLDKSGRWNLLLFFIRLARTLIRVRPEIIYSYLDLANVLALIAGKIFCKAKVVWAVRSAGFDLHDYDWLRRLGANLELHLSHFPTLVTVNSHAGLDSIIDRGFPRNKLTVIQNGIDTTHFRFDPETRIRLRKHWNVSHDEILIGLVARLDPIKDHHTFLKAAALVLKSEPTARFVCVGTGSSTNEEKLNRLVKELKLCSKVILAGERTDMRDVYSALDINCLTSINEGWPNVIGEAMSCGVPCVVTNVGDAAEIVGKTGFVSIARDVQAFASNIVLCMNADRELLRIKTRQRIESNWPLEKLVSDTERVLLNIVDGQCSIDLNSSRGLAKTALHKKSEMPPTGAGGTFKSDLQKTGG